MRLQVVKKVWIPAPHQDANKRNGRCQDRKRELPAPVGRPHGDGDAETHDRQDAPIHEQPWNRPRRSGCQRLRPRPAAEVPVHGLEGRWSEHGR